MASRTAVGFWAEAPLSRYTSGLPCTCSPRIGKSLRTRSTSKARVELSPDTGCVLSCPRMAMSVLPGAAGQPVADGGHQRRADALGGDVVHALGQEGLDEQGPRRGFRDAAGAQVEERVVVEVAGGRAVAADDVVGVDLQLGLGVDLRLVR